MKGGRRKRERDREGNLRINFVNRKVSQLTRRRLFFFFYKRGFFRKKKQANVITRIEEIEIFGSYHYYVFRLRDPCRPARRRTASLFRLIKHASTAMINYNL